MKLEEYLKWKEISVTKAAIDLNVQRQYLSEIASGRPPGRKLAMKIVEWSDGNISYDDLFKAA